MVLFSKLSVNCIWRYFMQRYHNPCKVRLVSCMLWCDLSFNQVVFQPYKSSETQNIWLSLFPDLGVERLTNPVWTPRFFPVTYKTMLVNVQYTSFVLLYVKVVFLFYCFHKSEVRNFAWYNMKIKKLLTCKENECNFIRTFNSSANIILLAKKIYNHKHMIYRYSYKKNKSIWLLFNAVNRLGWFNRLGWLVSLSNPKSEEKRQHYKMNHLTKKQPKMK